MFAARASAASVVAYSAEGAGDKEVFAEHWLAYAKIRQLDTINSQARRAEKRKTQYWARRDIAIGTIGVTYEF